MHVSDSGESATSGIGSSVKDPLPAKGKGFLKGYVTVCTYIQTVESFQGSRLEQCVCLCVVCVFVCVWCVCVCVCVCVRVCVCVCVCVCIIYRLTKDHKTDPGFGTLL